MKVNLKEGMCFLNQDPKVLYRIRRIECVKLNEGSTLFVNVYLDQISLDGTFYCENGHWSEGAAKMILRHCSPIEPKIFEKAVKLHDIYTAGLNAISESLPHE